MKTTIDIPTTMLQEAMRLTNAKTKREAVLAALQLLIRRKQAIEAAEMLGTFEDFWTPEELAEHREDS